MDHDLYLMLAAQNVAMARIERTINSILDKEVIIMATLQEVKDAIAAEAAEVTAKVNELEAKIVLLIAAGAGASAADLDELKTMVENIFVAPVEPPPA